MKRALILLGVGLTSLSVMMLMALFAPLLWLLLQLGLVKSDPPRRKSVIDIEPPGVSNS